MEIKFAKYHGCGNDFIIIRYEDNKYDYSELAKKLCNRNLSIGADGLIVVKKEPLEMIFYNADGSRGTMCGNGIRCFAKYCFDEKILTDSSFSVITLAGVIEVKKTNNDEYTINMGQPNLNTKPLKMKTDLPTFINQELQNQRVSCLFMGAIHTVIFVDKLEESIKLAVGEKICHDSIFEDRSNVNFVEVVDNNNFKVKTYERGVGWTLACGSGACSSFVIGEIMGYCQDEVNIHFQFGTLKIKKINDYIYMSGPAIKIADGLIY